MAPEMMRRGESSFRNDDGPTEDIGPLTPHPNYTTTQLGQEISGKIFFVLFCFCLGAYFASRGHAVPASIRLPFFLGWDLYLGLEPWAYPEGAEGGRPGPTSPAYIGPALSCVAWRRHCAPLSFIGLRLRL
jgi:hypothetical protein